MSHYPKYFSQLMLTLLVLCLSTTFAEAQRDTTGTAARTDSIVEYLTPLEYAFMMHEKTRFMLRLPAIGVGAEVEVLPYFTLMGQVYLNVPTNNSNNYTTLTAEARWYYGSKKIGVRNMSGNYFALGYEKNEIFYNEPQDKYFYGRWGIQRRFLGSGLLDMGIDAGFAQKPEYSGKINEGAFIRTNATVGLGIVFNKEKALDMNRLCPVLKCYEKETFLLKINTANLISAFHSDNFHFNEINLHPEITVEQKLFDTPFSLNVNFTTDYTWRNATNKEGENYYSSDTYLSGRAQARYYYNLKSRIRKGKCGDGLSANYIAGGIYTDYSMYSYNGHRSKYSNYNYGYLITTGIQRTLSNNFYLDVEYGLLRFMDTDDYDSGNYNLDIFGNIQLGIKF